MTKSASIAGKIDWPYSDMPFLPKIARKATTALIPDEEDCKILWHKYEMPEHIRQHSFVVAKIASEISARAESMGFGINSSACFSSALLHDLAKNYCIKYGGAHALLGGSWVLAETGNYAIAQGVLLHVHWPWALPLGSAICCLPIIVLYADKRARHNECVSLKERFEDILKRYGKTAESRRNIRFSWDQAKIIEQRLSKQLGWNLDEDTFNCGGLVN